MAVRLTPTLLTVVLAVASTALLAGDDCYFYGGDGARRPTLVNGAWKADFDGGIFNIWNEKEAHTPGFHSNGMAWRSKNPVGADGLVLDPCGNCYLRCGGEIYGLESGEKGKVIRVPENNTNPVGGKAFSARMVLTGNGDLSFEYRPDPGKEVWKTYCTITRGWTPIEQQAAYWK